MLIELKTIFPQIINQFWFSYHWILLICKIAGVFNHSFLASNLGGHIRSLIQWCSKIVTLCLFQSQPLWVSFSIYHPCWKNDFFFLMKNGNQTKIVSFFFSNDTSMQRYFFIKFCVWHFIGPMAMTPGRWLGEGNFWSNILRNMMK